jgi:hypothetical protein
MAWTWQIPTFDLTASLQVFQPKIKAIKFLNKLQLRLFILYLEPALQSPLRLSTAVRSTDSSTGSTGSMRRGTGNGAAARQE